MPVLTGKVRAKLVPREPVAAKGALLAVEEKARPEEAAADRKSVV